MAQMALDGVEGTRWRGREKATHPMTLGLLTELRSDGHYCAQVDSGHCTPECAGGYNGTLYPTRKGYNVDLENTKSTLCSYSFGGECFCVLKRCELSVW